MTKLILMAATVCLSLSSAQARLGETRAECEKRYGEEGTLREGVSYYEKSGYLIIVKYASNKCIYISYGRLDDKDLDNIEVATFLDVNRVNHEDDYGDWRTEVKGEWYLDHPKRYAVYNTKSFIVYNRDKYDPERKSNGVSDLDGF